MSQVSQYIYSANGIFRVFQRLLRRSKLLCRRYAEWHQLKRQHEALVRMEDRMLKDIGLSRSDIHRMSRGQNFWRHMFQPIEGDTELEPMRKEESTGKLDPI